MDTVNCVTVIPGKKTTIWLHNGLSDLGKEVLVEMNTWGMMIDVSHPSKESMRQMIELTKAPIIASHSSARALCDHSRNLDDEQLQWMKENGGVVQTVAFKSYLKTEKNNARAKIETQIAREIAIHWVENCELEEVGTVTAHRSAVILQNESKGDTLAQKKLATMKDLPPAVNVADFVDHIDYLVSKMGIEHVGISSDFDGGGGIEGWSDASETFNVTLELVRRGYSEEEIAMLWSGNLLRVLDEVEKVAKTLQQKS